MKNLLTIGIIVLAIQMSSCKTNETDNPINSEKEQNPISAKINNKFWAVPPLSSKLRNGTVNYDFYAGYNDPSNITDTNTIFLLGFGAYLADSVTNNSDKLGITINKFYGNAIYPISASNAVFLNSTGSINNPTRTTYFSEGDATDQVIISNYDKINKTISGTFSFSAKNEDSLTLRITEGSFNNLPIK